MKPLFSLEARIGTDVRLAMILLFTALTVLGITPFAVMRASNGQWLAVALEALLILCILACAAYTWKTRNTSLSGSIIVVLVSTGCAALTVVLGPSTLFWIYVVVVANFMLAPRLVATLCSILLVATGVVDSVLVQPAAVAGFGVTSVLVMLFAYIFASLTETQRSMLESLVIRDPLTGVANRRSMEVELADALKGHLARDEPATVAVLDLDHFKLVNDRYGHDAGDRAIRGFTDRVQSCIRKRDRLFRLGGEEFVLLLPGTDYSGARVALEKVRDAVQAEPLVDELRITTSIGAAVLEPADDWPRWLARADSALYQAKDEGRDRVSFDDATVRPGERRLRLVSGRPLR